MPPPVSTVANDVENTPEPIDAENTMEEGTKSEQRSRASVESLTIACDPEVYSLSGGTAMSSGSTATENGHTILTAETGMEMGVKVMFGSSFGRR